MTSVARVVGRRPHTPAPCLGPRDDVSPLRVGLAVSVVLAGAHVFLTLISGLDTTLRLIIEVAAAGAATGASWRWVVGPGWRAVRRGFRWTRHKLELVVKIDDRLGNIEARLERGDERFDLFDRALDVMQSEERAEVMAALRDRRPVRFREGGQVDRRRESRRDDDPPPPDLG